MADKVDRVTINVSLKREVVAELDFLATLWNMYRYEVMEQILERAIKRVKRESSSLDALS
jgi:hypothetical protein